MRILKLAGSMYFLVMACYAMVENDNKLLFLFLIASFFLFNEANPAADPLKNKD